MEPIHAELLRLATELEAVRGQVQTECNALTRPLCTDHGSLVKFRFSARPETEPQGIGRHLPQQFGGSRLDSGDFAFRMDGNAAVLSRDGQGGALLREVAKLEKFEDNTIETLGRTFWDVQQLSAAMAAALITCTRGEVATLVRRILSVSPEMDFKLGSQSHAGSNPDQCGGTSGVDGEAHIATAHQERE